MRRAGAAAAAAAAAACARALSAPPLSLALTVSLLPLRRVLSKTLAYVQTKRADLEPKPGFMRQLVALDQSLQRVSRAAARSKEDPSLRKCSEWDPELVLGAPAS